MRRKFKIQWVFVSVLITLTISGSFLYRNNSIGVVYFPKTTGSTTVAALILAPFKHVTKSLTELGKMDTVNKHVLFLNHVPKCGSEILILLLQNLQGFNSYRHVRLKGGNKRRLSRLEQEELVYEMYDTIKSEAVPLSFDRTVYYVNFTLFDKQLPTYINFIRDPVDRIMSRYSKKHERNDFLKCLTKKKNNCNYKNGQSYDLSIPYFCGHDSRCMYLNNNWAFNKAKDNVEKFYSVVGVLEELNTTLEVLENKVPYFFRGLQKTYQTGLIKNFKAKKMIIVSNSIRNKLKETLVKEYEFYEWIKQRLFGQLQIIYGDHNSH